MFESKLLLDILKYLPISDIVKTCSSLPLPEYQKICSNNDLWKYLLYRDYAVFMPIISILERPSYMSYFGLYKEFYFSPIFNSEDIRKLYHMLLQSTSLPMFLNNKYMETPIPNLIPYIPIDPNSMSLKDRIYRKTEIVSPYKLKIISYDDSTFDNLVNISSLLNLHFDTSYGQKWKIFTISMKIENAIAKFF